MNRILKRQSRRKKSRRSKSENSKRKNYKSRKAYSRKAYSRKAYSRKALQRKAYSRKAYSRKAYSRKKSSRVKSLRKPNRRMSRRKMLVFGFGSESKKDKIMAKYGVITIYGSDGCGACVNIKKVCDEHKINYTFIDRDSNNDEQNELIKKLKVDEDDKHNGMYKYIPIIICEKGNFLGGSGNFIKLINEI
jgi:glutaredoxin